MALWLAFSGDNLPGMATSTISYGKLGLTLFALSVITFVAYLFLSERGPTPNTEMQEYQLQQRQH